MGLPVLAVVAFTALYFWANGLVYFPIRFPDGEWRQQTAVGATEVWLTTRDGVRLNAWWVPASSGQLVTVFFHGNGGNLTHRTPHMRAIASAGSAVLIIDYRGYGKSAGTPAESGLYADADAAYEWLISQGHSPKKIIIQGESLGTAVAVELAGRKACAGVVLEAPFNSASQVAAGLLPLLGPLVIRVYNSKEKVGKIRAPLLFIHGDRDEVIPYKLGRDLFDAAPEPKSFWTIPGAGHNNLVDVAGDRYREKLAEFYASLARSE
jgi:fermentation-respiration switch protein FrsA (DUF1100 family)